MGHVCPWWLTYTFDNPLRALIHKPDTIFSGLVKEGQVVADIGCGFGFFSLAMAEIVSTTGRVYAIDVQPQMLEKVMKRARKRGLADRIFPRLCRPDELVIDEPIDFALAFWMVHETKDQNLFFHNTYSALKKRGALLVAEPKLHVSLKALDREIRTALDCGFLLRDTPQIAVSNAVVFEKP
jgi:ubiquinone/menaquinone biosynthesis C-methylase UbiE